MLLGTNTEKENLRAITYSYFGDVDLTSDLSMTATVMTELFMHDSEKRE